MVSQRKMNWSINFNDDASFVPFIWKLTMHILNPAIIINMKRWKVFWLGCEHFYLPGETSSQPVSSRLFHRSLQTSLTFSFEKIWVSLGGSLWVTDEMWLSGSGVKSIEELPGWRRWCWYFCWVIYSLLESSLFTDFTATSTTSTQPLDQRL